MTDRDDGDAERRLFRLKHLVPRELAAAAPGRAAGVACEETFFEVSWGRVAAKLWGPVDGRPVMAIHGWLDNAATFDKLIPMLPRDLRIVAVDLPGHGLSDHYPVDITYNFTECLIAFERLAERFGWTKFSIMGHSLGGAMAVLYAGVFPERVDKLVLLDIVRAETTKPEYMHIRFRKVVNVLLKQEKAIKAGPEKPMSYASAVKRNIYGSCGSLDEEACHILFKRGLRATEGGYVFTRDRRLKAAPLAFVPKEDQLLLAKEVTAQVLVIKFIDGPYFESPHNYEEQVEALRFKTKSLEYIEVEGRHHVHLTQPEECARHISRFFQS